MLVESMAFQTMRSTRCKGVRAVAHPRHHVGRRCQYERSLSGTTWKPKERCRFPEFPLDPTRPDLWCLEKLLYLTAHWRFE